MEDMRDQARVHGRGYGPPFSGKIREVVMQQQAPALVSTPCKEIDYGKLFKVVAFENVSLTVWVVGEL